MRTDRDGRGIINILAADKLMENPRLYATFLLWLLSELFEELPEVGDPDKPKLVFFFDEAHLLFNDAPKALLDKIEQVVRLIRSKGVGVYFVTQNPLDVPDTVLAQLGNRVQHALRAFTPRDQKAVRAAAETFRANPKLDTAKVDHRARQGRGAGLVARGQGHAVDGRAHADPPAVGAGRPDHAGGAQGDHGARARSRASTTRRSIANPPTRCCRSALQRDAARPRRRSRGHAQPASGPARRRKRRRPAVVGEIPAAASARPVGGACRRPAGRAATRLSTGQQIGARSRARSPNRVAGADRRPISASRSAARRGSSVGRAIVRRQRIGPGFCADDGAS